MDLTNLIIIITTLFASAFFSGIEIAFISASRLKIELDKNQGALSGKILSFFVRNSSRFISTLLLGNNASLVIYGIYMALAIEPKIQQYVVNEAAVLLIQTILSTLIVLITAEFLPKAIFRINPNRTLNFFSIILVVIYVVFYIPTLITTTISKIILKVFKVDISATEQAFTMVDLDDYVRDLNDRMEDQAEMENEIQILQNALEFNKVKARDCMVPRTEIAAMNIEDDLSSLRDMFIETGLSKILIYRDNIDNIIGYVHSFELFKKPETIKQILLPISIVPEASLVQVLLEQFAKQKRSIAVVVDEFGGTSGLITVEDIIEEIFGEIEDEHDSEELIELKINDQKYHFSARHEISYINDKYGFDIEESEEYSTLSGFVVNELEEIPQRGDSFSHKNYEIIIEKVSDTRVEEIILVLE